MKMLNETRMPSGVIRHKQRLDSMTDAEFAEKHKDKTDDELRSMAWRHGYGKGAGKGSDHYVNRRNKGLKEEDMLEGKTWRATDVDSYKAKQSIKRKIKDFVNTRKQAQIKRNINEDSDDLPDPKKAKVTVNKEKRYSSDYLMTIHNDHHGRELIKHIRAKNRERNKTSLEKYVIKITGRLGKNSPHYRMYKDNNIHQNIKAEHAERFDIYHYKKYNG